ncbi:MAG: polymer-forming cytoskeletal protein [Acidobacteriota bacterium]
MKQVGAVALAFLLLPVVTTAAEFRGSVDGQVVVGQDEVISGDLYASGTTVIVDGVVLGDLVAFGREILLNGRVEGDLITAGQTIVVQGVVGDDARLAGRVLQLAGEATIGDHLIAAGYSFEAESDTRVEGELFFAGAKALVAGVVESDLRLAGTAVEIGGEVAGDAEVELSGGTLETASWFEALWGGPVPSPSVVDGLTVDDSARIRGMLSYVAPEEFEVPEVAADNVHWQPSPTDAEPEAAEATSGAERLSRLAEHLRRVATLLIFGLLLFWWAPGWVRGRAEQLEAEPLESLGWGAVCLLGAPVAAFTILLLTIALAALAGALSLGGLVSLVLLVGLAMLVVLVVGFAVAAGFTAQVLVSAAAGRAALQRARPGQASSRWATLLLGLLLYALVTGLPYLGTIVAFLVAALGLGSVAQWAISALLQGRELETA